MISATILPPATLGVLGGGQLGRYFVHAAHELGYRVIVLDPDPDSPAGVIADQHLVAGYEDTQALLELANRCAAITTEFENVPAATLSWLAQQKIPVHPGPEAVAICQNRIEEKRFLTQSALPLGPYAEIHSEQDIDNAAEALFPSILKTARLGYDGKGQARVTTREAAKEAFRRFGGVACVMEKQLALQSEVSVVIARNPQGEVAGFPPTQNHHCNGILDYSMMPASDISEALATEAQRLAQNIATHLKYIGTLSVEFFVVDNALLINEMAPRPHNSGHYTLDACKTNQFEQQVRALCGLPLGDPQAHCNAVMVNLLGDLWRYDAPDQPQPPDWSVLLSIPALKLHFYGKDQPRPGRKMGHFTLLGASPAELKATALSAQDKLKTPRTP